MYRLPSVDYKPTNLQDSFAHEAETIGSSNDFNITTSFEEDLFSLTSEEIQDLCPVGVRRQNAVAIDTIVEDFERQLQQDLASSPTPSLARSNAIRFKDVAPLDKCDLSEIDVSIDLGNTTVSKSSKQVKKTKKEKILKKTQMKERAFGRKMNKLMTKE